MQDVSKYPLQVAVIKRKEITLGIDANFERAGKAVNSRGEETVIPPLSMHGPRSCFRWTLIDKSGSQPVYPNANIPCDELAALRTRVNAVIAQNTLKSVKTPQQKETGNQGPAYTVKIRMPKFKGRSPAEILLENSENLNELLNIREYLMKQGSNSRYWESNQQQIQAIEDAAALFKEDKLSAEAVGNNSSASIVVYHRPQKILLNRPAKGDHYFTYSFKIECIPSYNYPWTITIDNQYMKVKKVGDMTQTIPETGIYRTSAQLQIADYEMGYIIERMHSTVANFELIFFKAQYNEALRQYSILRESFHSRDSVEDAA